MRYIGYVKIYIREGMAGAWLCVGGRLIMRGDQGPKPERWRTRTIGESLWELAARALFSNSARCTWDDWFCDLTWVISISCTPIGLMYEDLKNPKIVSAASFTLRKRFSNSHSKMETLHLLSRRSRSCLDSVRLTEYGTLERHMMVLVFNHDSKLIRR